MSHTREDVVRAVREALQSHQPQPVDVSVSEDEVKEEAGVWQVPVKPRTFPVSMYGLYDAFADIEIDLEDQRRMKVILLPAMP